MIDWKGEPAREWVRRLPRLVAACAEKWSLTLDPPREDSHYSYLAPARRADGTAAMLKLSFRARGWATGVAALRCFAGRGAVLLLEVEEEAEAILLERLEPGETLRSLDDEVQATSIATRVMRELWRPAPETPPFRSGVAWADSIVGLRDRVAPPFPMALAEEAEARYRELIAAPPEQVLVHGDIHFANILSARRQPWLAIDPLGLVAERAFEGGFLFGYVDPVQDVIRRLDQAAEELAADRERLRGWGIVVSVLSASWNFADGGNEWPAGTACAESLAAGRR